MTPLRLSASQASLLFPFFFFCPLCTSVTEGGWSPVCQSLSPAGPALFPHLAAALAMVGLCELSDFSPEVQTQQEKGDDFATELPE